MKIFKLQLELDTTTSSTFIIRALDPVDALNTFINAKTDAAEYVELIDDELFDLASNDYRITLTPITDDELTGIELVELNDNVNYTDI